MICRIKAREANPDFSEMHPQSALCFADTGMVFSQIRPAGSPGEALAKRIESYMEMATSLTYWQAYALATTT